jgi:hypothetical protein
MQRVMANLLGRIAPAKQQVARLPAPSPDSSLLHPFAASASALSTGSSTRDSSAHSAAASNLRSGSKACSAAAMVLMQLRANHLHPQQPHQDPGSCLQHPDATDLTQAPPSLDQSTSLPGGLRSRLSRVSNSDGTFLATCPLPTSSSYPYPANHSAAIATTASASPQALAGRLYRLAHSPLMELFTLRPHMVRNFNLRLLGGRPSSPTAATPPPAPPPALDDGNNNDGVDRILFELEQEAGGRAPVVPASPRVSPPQRPGTPPTEPRIAARASFRSSDPQLPQPRADLHPLALLRPSDPSPPASSPTATMPPPFAHVCISDPLTLKLGPSTQVHASDFADSAAPRPPGKRPPTAPDGRDGLSPPRHPLPPAPPPALDHLSTIFQKAKSMDPAAGRREGNGLALMGWDRPPLRQSRSCVAAVSAPHTPPQWPALLQHTSACT